MHINDFAIIVMFFHRCECTSTTTSYDDNSTSHRSQTPVRWRVILFSYVKNMQMAKRNEACGVFSKHLATIFDLWRVLAIYLNLFLLKIDTSNGFSKFIVFHSFS